MFSDKSDCLFIDSELMNLDLKPVCYAAVTPIQNNFFKNAFHYLK